MKKYIPATLITLFLFTLLVGQRAHAQTDNNKVLDVLANDGRFTQFVAAAQQTGVNDMLNGWGPYTVFAPSDAAFASLAPSVKNDPVAMRQIVLNHIVAGQNIKSAQLWSNPNLGSALGRQLAVARSGNSLKINGIATITRYDVPASNGNIHHIDAVLLPSNVVASPQTDQPAPSAPTATPAPVLFDNPTSNPAYVPGGHIQYWQGTSPAYAGCRGMTWVLLAQRTGVSKVGADRRTNPYRGDETCSKSLPMLCVQTTGAIAPDPETASAWVNGKLKLTTFVAGTQLNSLATANGICRQQFGQGYRMASFHENSNSWEYWAVGGDLPINQRFWVFIADQAANPWNNAPIQNAPPNVASGPAVTNPWENPAYVSGARISKWQGEQAGRSFCKGMSWVVLHQTNNTTLVGADAKTNPYRGDTACFTELPVLCIQVGQYPAPPFSQGQAFSGANWSGGQVRATGPVRGEWLQSRQQGTEVCQNSFGAGWRMAQHHDGSLSGTGNGGWEFWAYGGLPIGTRFWVSISDQPANPWDAWGSNR
jgi:uncharacterized surface protein with fasciclin (FAS1) repeats